MQKRPWTKESEPQPFKHPQKWTKDSWEPPQECGESWDRMSIERETVIQDSITTKLRNIKSEERVNEWVREWERESEREREKERREEEREREKKREREIEIFVPTGGKLALYSLVLEPVVSVYAATAHNLGARSRCHVCHSSAHSESCKSL